MNFKLTKDASNSELNQVRAELSDSKAQLDAARLKNEETDNSLVEKENRIRLLESEIKELNGSLTILIVFPIQFKYLLMNF